MRDIVAVELLGCPQDSSIATQGHNVVDFRFKIVRHLSDSFKFLGYSILGYHLVRATVSFVQVARNDNIEFADIFASLRVLDALNQNKEVLEYFIVSRLDEDHDP